MAKGPGSNEAQDKAPKTKELKAKNIDAIVKDMNDSSGLSLKSEYVADKLVALFNSAEGSIQNKKKEFVKAVENEYLIGYKDCLEQRKAQGLEPKLNDTFAIYSAYYNGILEECKRSNMLPKDYEVEPFGNQKGADILKVVAEVYKPEEIDENDLGNLMEVCDTIDNFRETKGMKNEDAPMMPNEEVELPNKEDVIENENVIRDSIRDEAPPVDSNEEIKTDEEKIEKPIESNINNNGVGLLNENGEVEKVIIPVEEEKDKDEVDLPGRTTIIEEEKKIEENTKKDNTPINTDNETIEKPTEETVIGSNENNYPEVEENKEKVNETPTVESPKLPDIKLDSKAFDKELRMFNTEFDMNISKETIENEINKMKDGLEELSPEERETEFQDRYSRYYRDNFQNLMNQRTDKLNEDPKADVMSMKDSFKFFDRFMGAVDKELKEQGLIDEKYQRLAPHTVSAKNISDIMLNSYDGLKNKKPSDKNEIKKIDEKLSKKQKEYARESFSNKIDEFNQKHGTAFSSKNIEKYLSQEFKKCEGESIDEMRAEFKGKYKGFLKESFKNMFEKRGLKEGETIADASKDFDSFSKEMEPILKANGFIDKEYHHEPYGGLTSKEIGDLQREYINKQPKSIEEKANRLLDVRNEKALVADKKEMTDTQLSEKRVRKSRMLVYSVPVASDDGKLSPQAEKAINGLKGLKKARKERSIFSVLRHPINSFRESRMISKGLDKLEKLGYNKDLVNEKMGQTLKRSEDPLVEFRQGENQVQGMREIQSELMGKVKTAPVGGQMTPEAQKALDGLRGIKKAHNERGFFGKLFHPIDSIRESRDIKRGLNELEQKGYNRTEMDRQMENTISAVDDPMKEFSKEAKAPKTKAQALRDILNNVQDSKDAGLKNQEACLAVAAIKNLDQEHSRRGFGWKLRHPILNYRENKVIKNGMAELNKKGYDKDAIDHILKDPLKGNDDPYTKKYNEEMAAIDNFEREVDKQINDRDKSIADRKKSRNHPGKKIEVPECNTIKDITNPEKGMKSKAVTKEKEVTKENTINTPNNKK